LLKPCCKRCEVVDSDTFYDSESKDSDYTDSLAEDSSLSSSLVEEDADQGETFDGSLLFSRMQTHNLTEKIGKSNFDHLFQQGKSDEEFSWKSDEEFSFMTKPNFCSQFNGALQNRVDETVIPPRERAWYHDTTEDDDSEDKG